MSDADVSQESQARAKLPVEAVVFDVGRVLFEWDLRHLFAKLIEEPDELEWFLGHVVTEEWHFQHDAGRSLEAMVAERQAEFPEWAEHIAVYATRFPETIPGPVPGALELVEQLSARCVPLYAITNFGAEFWAQFAPSQPVFERFQDIVVSGEEKLIKPDPAIFALAAERFQRDPAALLFVDDNADNIAAAGRLGWQVHHFRDADGLAERLKAEGLI